VNDTTAQHHGSNGENPMIAPAIVQPPAAPLSAPFDWAAWDARRRVLDAEIEAMFRETDRLLAEVHHAV